MSRLVLIVNPYASRVTDELVAAVEQVLEPAQTLRTERAGHATELARAADAEAVADRITNAGAIFVGAWSPVSLGDYCAGSNHVLPTGGCARHSGGLSVQTFLRGIHVIDYTRDALREVADRVITLAIAEDLFKIRKTAHVQHVHRKSSFG